MTRYVAVGLLLTAVAFVSEFEVRAAPDTCAEQQQQLDTQAQNGDWAGAARRLNQIAESPSCSGDRIDEAKMHLSHALVRQAARLQNNEARHDEYRTLLVEAARYRVSWEASWRLADLQMRQKQFREAAVTYQQAIEILGSRLDKISRDQRDTRLIETGKYLVQRSDEARHLAASGEDSSTNGFVSAVAGHRGERFGGVYNEEFGRGLAATKVPPPITFDYDSTAFTPVGQQAAAELRDLLRDRHPGRVVVTGHTDQKGTDAYNLDLSRRRAMAVIAYLKANGLTAVFTAVGKGRAEPRVLSNEADYSPAEVDQLNRRVEIDWQG